MFKAHLHLRHRCDHLESLLLDGMSVVKKEWLLPMQRHTCKPHTGAAEGAEENYDSNLQNRPQYVLRLNSCIPSSPDPNVPALSHSPPSMELWVVFHNGAECGFRRSRHRSD